jgi:hypothetical protein
VTKKKVNTAIPGDTEIIINGVQYIRSDYIKPSTIVCHKRKEGPWEIGGNYLIRASMSACYGVLVDVVEKEIIMRDVVWFEYSKFFNIIENAPIPCQNDYYTITEVSKYVIINRDSISFALPVHKLFK